MFAQNDEGDTALHLAVSRAEKLHSKASKGGGDDEETVETFPVVQKLIEMVKKGSDSDRELARLLQLRNKEGKTVLDCCPQSPFGKKLSTYLNNTSRDISQEDFTFEGVKLRSENIQKIRNSSSLQTILAYWKHFDSKCNE